MKLTIEKGNTLLVDGPASVTLLSGVTSILGSSHKKGSKIVIRSGKRLPFEVLRHAKLELALGESASYSIIDGSTIPQSWKDAVNLILSKNKIRSVTVLGEVDSGKTSFCTYLTNQLLTKGHKVIIIDGDLGQSDIGPPATVGMGLVSTPIIDLFGIPPESVIFVGSTSPSKVIDLSLNALSTLRKKAIEKNANFLITNTDGWIEGYRAIDYKAKLVKLVDPDIIIGIQKGNELEPLLTELKDKEILVIKSPRHIRKREREVRKNLREMAYRKYLKEARVKSYPLSWVKIRGTVTKIDDELDLERKSIEEVLGVSPIYCKDLANRIIIFLHRTGALDEERVRKLEKKLGKNVRVMREGDEAGYLMGLEDSEGNLLGIGILCCLDFEKRTIKLYTSVNASAPTIHIGQVKLDLNRKEIC